MLMLGKIIVGLIIWLEIVLKLVGFDFWGKFVGSNTRSNKGSWNSWLVLKRTDRCQLLLFPG